MDAKEFSVKLTDLMTLAIRENRTLNRAQISSMFQEDQLDENQMKLIYQYLKSQNVTLTDIEMEADEEENVSADPLDPQEEEYLREYLESLPGKRDAARMKMLWEQIADGNSESAGELAEYYFREVTELCRQNHKSAYYIGDMIQDLNLQLILLLGGGTVRSEKQLREELNKSVAFLISEYDENQFQDNYLVQRVQKLENALKEITDEDEESNFSVEELSVFLDMSVEEIQDILKLTGEENEN